MDIDKTSDFSIRVIVPVSIILAFWFSFNKIITINNQVFPDVITDIAVIVCLPFIFMITFINDFGKIYKFIFIVLFSFIYTSWLMILAIEFGYYSEIEKYKNIERDFICCFILPVIYNII